jgi:hypothetical protein
MMPNDKRSLRLPQDVSGLFPDVLKNMQTEDLEQKKLVYLYLMNYAKTQPELVILAVNTFVKVSTIRSVLLRMVFSLFNRIRTTQTPSSVHSPFVPWDVFVQRRLLTISVHRCKRL